MALAALLAVAVIVAVIVLTTTGSTHSTGPTARSTPVNVHPALATIEGRGFSATAPAGWKLDSAVSRKGARRWQLSSTGAPLSGLGLPPAGTIGITIDEASSGRLAASSPTELLAESVGVPRGAQHVQRPAGPRAVRLAGSPAAEEAYTYTFRGIADVQVDVVAHHAGRTFLVELDAEPTLGAASEAALQHLFSSWRWR